MVSRLIRTRHGPIALPRGLKRGRWEELEDNEVRSLMAAVGLKAPVAEKGGRSSAPRVQPDPMQTSMGFITREPVLSSHSRMAQQQTPNGRGGRRGPSNGGMPGTFGLGGMGGGFGGGNAGGGMGGTGRRNGRGGEANGNRIGGSEPNGNRANGPRQARGARPQGGPQGMGGGNGGGAGKRGPGGNGNAPRGNRQGQGGQAAQGKPGGGGRNRQRGR
jgi:23S rRNA pseudouridine2605 synthase